ncbi:hypothetical protein L1987_81880 [Smallanthus sonchifolius]|uniref:Uncharacterized protein n=1 Tax=Smallanthus sonchifolius TaxID=185202 RepID=A0ACB8YSE4_9ASTR|nr:hypothetical protein L1987_81880 [Smallanthus sonchifolius]
MAADPNYCFTNTYEDVLASSLQSTTNDSIVFNLSILKEKAQYVHSTATVFFTQSQTQSMVCNSASVNVNIANLLQEIIAIASNVMFTCQNIVPVVNHDNTLEFDQLTQSSVMFEWPGGGFKRDANLRMHMRAHGDEYKSVAALANPISLSTKQARKYSCPQEGCRWNRKHAKFQPLKSMICMKNHYKRSHCPKMYSCQRCHQKQFSVLSDLRTHEKHCGDVKWRCSCGTTFSRKDKLMGHVGLFIGHTPVSDTSSLKFDQ